MKDENKWRNYVYTSWLEMADFRMFDKTTMISIVTLVNI